MTTDLSTRDSTGDGGPAGHHTTGPSWFWLVVRSLGELLLTVGVLVVFFVVYQFAGAPGQVAAMQRQLDSELRSSWQAAEHPKQAVSPVGPLAEGTPFARLSLPALGLSWTVVEGVSRSSLHEGPGHYPGTAMPGQVGNFAVAGHRERGVFGDLDQIAAGDTVIVETAAAWFTYRVYQTEIVLPTDLAVIAPTPDRPDLPATAATLTLTTCNPRWGNYQRLIVHSRLDNVRAK